MKISHFVKPSFAALISALVLSLTGCGSGGGGSPAASATPTITGLAATGAAFPNATVTAKCTAGPAVTGKTGIDGTFTLALADGQTLPCMVEVTDGTTTLHSFAADVGHINVTPLTELVVSKALGSDPAAAFAAFDSGKGDAIKNGLAAAKTYVKTEVTALTGGSQTGDPLTEDFKVGDSEDKVLEDLKTALAATGKEISDLRVAAEAGDSMEASVDRGSLLDSDPPTVLATLTAAQIDAGTAASGLQALSGKAKCDVKVVALDYNTIGVKGEKTNDSGVMLVPVPNGANCAGPAALVAYAKGTDVQKLRTLANPSDPETFLLVAMYASQGYAVVATDYLGFAKSAYSYHPYLHADSEASSVIDSIRAARKAAATVGATLSGKVMLTGYSQGGHSSMAAERAIERDYSKEINVVAGAYLAGPYNLSGSFRLTNAIAGYQFFVPYLVTSWEKVYGDVYSDVNAAFKAPYAATIESLLPSATLNYATLITTGALPGKNGETPNQARDELFQPAFLADVQTNDKDPLYLDAKKNDLLGWSPKAKVLLCGGAGDPTVPPAVHMNVMKADFDSRKLTNVTSVDVDPMVQAAYGVLASPTATAKTAPTDPTSAAFATYYANYHGSYEPPFCHAQAKALFDSVS